jgi:perosamine synthetase
MHTSIPLSAPSITDLERQAVLEVLNGPVLSIGPKVQAFEAAFADYTGNRYAVAVNSGTSGLQLALEAVGVGPGDAVITTPYSFIASANCILMRQASPIFSDIDPQSWTLDPQAVLRTLETHELRDRIKAIIPVHVFGVPCHMSAFRAIAQEYNLKLVEDACEALGTYEDDARHHVGYRADAAVYGFYPNKSMTTGEGGMIVTNDKDIDTICRSLRNQGRGNDAGWLVHERLGYNYRLSEINAALGLVQIQRIRDIHDKRNQVAAWYRARLEDDPRVTFQACPIGERSWFVLVVKLSSAYSAQTRNDIVTTLRKRGIGSAPYFPSIHLQPLYRNLGFKPGDFPIAEGVADRTLALPFFTDMTEEQVDQVVTVFRQVLDEHAIPARARLMAAIHA